MNVVCTHSSKPFALCVAAVLVACAPKENPVEADELATRRGLAAMYADTYILPDRAEYFRAKAIAEVGRGISEGSEAASEWKGMFVPTAFDQTIQVLAPNLKEQVVEALASNFDSSDLRNLIDSEAISRRAEVQAAMKTAAEAPVEQRSQILRGAMSLDEYKLVFQRTPPAKGKEWRLLNQLEETLVSTIEKQMEQTLLGHCKSAPNDITFCDGISRNP